MQRREFLKFIGALGALSLLPDRAWGAELKGRYEIRAPLPIPVQEIYPALFQGRMVVAGGLAREGTTIMPTAKTQVYEPAANRWVSGPDLPFPLHHPYLITFQGRLWSLGGYQSSPDAPWQMQSHVFTLSPAMQFWEPGPALPEPRAEFCAGTVGKRLIVSGGRKLRGRLTGQVADHTNAAETFVFDRGAWVIARPLPTTRNSAAAGVLNGKLHVVGGRQVLGTGEKEGQINVTAHEAYDPEEDHWHNLAPLPEAQAGAAAAVLQGRLYVFGGERFTEPKTVFGLTWEYDPKTDRWQSVKAMPVPRHGHGAVAIKNGIHLVGGGELVSAGKTSGHHSVFYA